MQITTQRARPAWPPMTMTLDCSRIAKEIAMVSGSFVEGCFILASDKNQKDQKNLQSKLVDYCLKQDDHKQRS